MKDNFLIKIFIVLAALILPVFSFAVCPVCTVGAAAGLGLLRELGVKDVITGVWLGGLLVSLVYWTRDVLKRKNINFWLMDFWLFLIWYGLTIIPLCLLGYLKIDLYFWGCYFNSLILGSLVGALVFWFGAEWYFYLKEKYQRALFPFQKVVMPLGGLVILSLIYYLFLK